jgi:hypothetical protein
MYALSRAMAKIPEGGGFAAHSDATLRRELGAAV